MRTSTGISSALLSVLVLATLSVVTVQQCYPSTCGDGPVTAFFQSQDCSGEPAFYPFTNDAYNTCLGSMGSTPAFRSFNISANGLEEYSGESLTCSTTDPNVNFITKFHSFYVCRPPTGRAKDEYAGAGSQLLLPNVNATYVAPQSLLSNSSLPDLNVLLSEQNCPATDSCDLPYSTVDYWTTATDPQCTPTSSTGLYNITFDRTCYRQSSSFFYMTFECASEHVRVTNYFVGNGCEHLYQVETQQGVCSSTNFGIYHCRASPLAPVPYANPFEPVAPVEPVVPVTEPLASTSPVPVDQSPAAPATSAPSSGSSMLVPTSLFLLTIVIASYF